MALGDTLSALADKLPGIIEAAAPLLVRQPTTSRGRGRNSGLGSAPVVNQGTVFDPFGPGAGVPFFPPSASGVPVPRSPSPIRTAGFNPLALVDPNSMLGEMMSFTGGGGDEFFRESAGSTRLTPVREITRENPRTGHIQVWRNMGRPVLFSGDLATCKRVRKVSRRAAGGVGLKFKTAPRRRR